MDFAIDYRRHHRLKAVLLVFCSFSASPAAFAQKVEENAVTEAEDAFGKSIGSERTGLYGNDDVRGFSPVDAGNTRIEGLYFDQVDRLSQRLIQSSTIHVGISAQHYPFPAPTGIVDYRLTDTSGPFTAALDMEIGEYGGPRFSAEMQTPIVGDSLSFAMGFGGRNQAKPEGGTITLRNLGVLATWRPYAGASLTAFAGGINSRDDEARPTLFPTGNLLPPEMPRRVFLGQEWAEKSYNIRSMGAIALLPMGEWRIDAGLFRSKRDYFHTHADLMSGIAADGSVASRTIIADGNNLDDSVSGEVRLTRAWKQGAFTHELTASLRGRDKRRLFGGTQRILLGPSSAFEADFRPAPAVVLGPENADHVRQVTYGAGYSLNWSRHGSLEGSVSKIAYRKTVDFADPLRGDVMTRDDPIVWNLSASAILSNRLALYAGYVTGLEEALIAPEIAVNRSESPPAIHTRQIDAGLRFAITPKITLVAGLFSVRKPYYNLDPAQRYRELGVVESRGVELSLTGQVRPGLSVVLGTVLLDPKISGEAVKSGLIGERPIASLTRRSIANIDWRPGAGTSPFSLDVAIDSQSARNANSANTLSAPALTRINLGGRFRFDLASHKALIRVQALNLFDSYGWNVSSSGGFTYTDSRTVTVQLLIDF